MPKEKLTDMPQMQAIGRLSNPFMYETEIFHCGLDLLRLDNHLNAQARKGWKLHTIDRLADGHYFFCVWEKLDYGEEKNK